MKHGIRYGHDRDGNKIAPRDGERILKEGEPLPPMYRPWLNGSGWLGPTKLHTHPGANQTAQVYGNYWAYAVPKDETAHLLASEANAARLRASIAELNRTHEPEAEIPSEDVLGLPVVVSETPAEPVEDLRAKKSKRKQQMRESYGLTFDD